MAEDSRQAGIDPEELRAVSDCTGMNLRKAARVVTQHFDAKLAPTGLKITQLSVLAALAPGPVALGKLADELVMDRTTLTRNLKPLMRTGLIAEARGEDRRLRKISLTTKGSEALAKSLPYWREAQDELTDEMGHMHWRVLLDNLRGAIRAAKEL